MFGSNNNNNTGFSFGQQQNSNQPQQSTGGLFGQNNNTQPQQQSGGLFGQQQNNNQQPGGLFGAKPVAPSGGLFGNNTTSQQPSTGGLFGQQQSNTTQPSTGGLFGQQQSNTTQPSTGGLFGQQQSNTTQPSGGLFGAKPLGSTSTGTTGGLFGQTNTNNQQPTGGLFGQNNNTQQQTGGLFGAKPAAPTGGLFGNNNTNSTIGGGGLFGAKPAGSSLGGGLFGQNNTQQQQQQPQVSHSSYIPLIRNLNINPTTKIQDLPEEVKKELILLNKYLETQVMTAYQIKTEYNQHQQLMESIPNDLKFLNKLHFEVKETLLISFTKVSKVRASIDDIFQDCEMIQLLLQQILIDPINCLVNIQDLEKLLIKSLKLMQMKVDELGELLKHLELSMNTLNTQIFNNNNNNGTNDRDNNVIINDTNQGLILIMDTVTNEFEAFMKLSETIAQLHQQVKQIKSMQNK